MTDNEIITHIAKAVMGWEVFPLDRAGYSEHEGPKLIENIEHAWVYFGTREIGTNGTRHATVAWNPLFRIEDAFEMQAALLAMKTGIAPKMYILRMNDMAYGGNAVVSTVNLAKFFLTATPRQRCLAAVQATS